MWTICRAFLMWSTCPRMIGLLSDFLANFGSLVTQRAMCACTSSIVTPGLSPWLGARCPMNDEISARISSSILPFRAVPSTFAGGEARDGSKGAIDVFALRIHPIH